MDYKECETRPWEIVHQRISLLSDGIESPFLYWNCLKTKNEIYSIAFFLLYKKISFFLNC